MQTSFEFNSAIALLEMTGDEEECAVVGISQLEKSLSSSNTSLSTAQPVTAAFITSNMTVGDHCIYTTAIPSELAGNFPEGMYKN